MRHRHVDADVQARAEVPSTGRFPDLLTESSADRELQEFVSISIQNVLLSIGVLPGCR